MGKAVTGEEAGTPVHPIRMTRRCVALRKCLPLKPGQTAAGRRGGDGVLFPKDVVLSPLPV